jgi:hypothetical protein
MKSYFQQFLKKPTITLISILLGFGSLWLLLALYSNLSIGNALFTALLYFVFLGVMIFVYYFIKPFVKNSLIGIILHLTAHIIVLSVVFLILSIFEIISFKQFLEIIPLLFIFGIMFWNLNVWGNDRVVSIQKNKYKQNDIDMVDLSSQSEIIEREIKPLERISIKQASEVAILKIEEIFHLEAYGDYVLIFTEKNKYIKEQTMKYFETNLPSQFIRIHRSYIINTDHIIRLEQYGKENYNIRLRNGISLRVSISGYKLLKEHLAL